MMREAVAHAARAPYAILFLLALRWRSYRTRERVLCDGGRQVMLPLGSLCAPTLTAAQHSEALDHIEDMLRKQLVAATGKEV